MNFTTIYVVICYMLLIYIQNKERFKKRFKLCT